MAKKTIIDFIQDDPCHGCKYATLIPDYQFDNIFSRRFGCLKVKNRDWLVNKATELLNNSTAPDAVAEALKYLNAANEADEFFKTHGFYKCGEASIGHPGCFENKGNVEHGDGNGQDNAAMH